MKNNKILIIIPWYGNLPIYFNLYLKGVEKNKEIIDVLFITDNEIKEKIPTNFIVKKIKFIDFQIKLSEALGNEINFEKPYKLCDFKPMMGKIFEKELKDYDFWGYGDIDVIYGDLKKFLSPINLRIYDVLTFREYIISGAFTILRNNAYTRNLYSRSKTLETVYNSQNYVCFDEAGRKIGECRKRIPAYKLLHIDNLECWTSIIQREFHEGRLNLYSKYELIEYCFPGINYYYLNGSIKMGADEFVAYHFISEKKSECFTFPNWKTIPDSFTFNYTGFYQNDDFTFKIISKWRFLSGNFLKLKKRALQSFNYRMLKK